MIIGNGLLAKGFINSNINHDDFIIFCSGVSNSKEMNYDNFNREKELVIKTITENKNLKFIYFSSILTGVSNNNYYNHKIDVENLIKKESNNYIIFRVPQIIGNIGNKNNLFNFLKESILNDEEINIFENVKRALLDIDDLIDIVNYCKDKVNSEIINISYIEKISVLELVGIISNYLNKIPKIKTIFNKTVDNWDIKNSEIIYQYINDINIKTNGYTNKIVKKYI